MLVLSRRPGEEILISVPARALAKALVGDPPIDHVDVRLTVVEIRPGGSVKIGIEAPRHIVVLRSELASRPSAATPSAQKKQN